MMRTLILTIVVIVAMAGSALAQNRDYIQLSDADAASAKQAYEAMTAQMPIVTNRHQTDLGELYHG
jgi:hypothetical protein